MREWLKRWVFRDEIREIELQKARWQMLADESESYGESLSIVDLVRDQLKGFNPRLLDTEDELIQIVGDEDSQEAFLNQVNELAKNTALPKIFDHLVREQVMYSAKEAPTLETINFGRASVNGVELVREEVERLKTLFDERHAPKEDFDQHEVL